MLAGTWDVTIKTPIGSLAVAYTFAESGGALTGSATLRDDTVTLQDLAIDGARATWRQSVTKPMRLNLDFDVVVDGDRCPASGRPLPAVCQRRTMRPDGGAVETLPRP
ncbi:MAG: hypothetical protein QOF25_3586 [Mycobacterium sp.]|nr:hypothetical protein [Mycobacterium sp.]